MAMDAHHKIAEVSLKEEEEMIFQQKGSSRSE